MTTTAGLGGAAARGAATTMGAQLLRVAINMAGIVLLARLLAPSDYGLLVMVTAIVGVGEILRDFGLSTAAIQSKTLTDEERDNLFWTNTAIGAVLTVVVVGLSFMLPAVYDEPRLQAIAAALSLTFLLNGASTQQRADLTRRLQFGRLAIAETVAPLIGIVTAVILALAGAGYWALVTQQLLTAASALVVLVVMTRWIPRGPHRGVSIRRFVSFGLNLFGVQLLTYASRNVDSIVVGARFGPSALGLYDRAFQLLVFPLNQINAPATRVALPVLSRLQDDAERFSAFLLRGQAAMVYAITLAFALAAAQAPAVIAILLGEQWAASAPIFQALALGGIAQVLSYATYWVFLAFGKTASNLRYSLVTRPLVIVAVLIGSMWGPVGVALGYGVALLAFWPLGLWWISRITPAPSMRMFALGIRALVVSALSAAMSWLSTRWLDMAPPIDLLVGAGAFVATLAVLVLVWPRARRDVGGVWSLRSSLKRGRS